ncbi:hypothetical protein SVIOM74S_03181 [Streptomyces violarus]
MAAAVGSWTRGQCSPSPARAAAADVALFWCSAKEAGTVITAASGGLPVSCAASWRRDLSTSAESCSGVRDSPARRNRRWYPATPISSLNSAWASSGWVSVRSRARRPTWVTSGLGIHTADGV